MLKPLVMTSMVSSMRRIGVLHDVSRCLQLLARGGIRVATPVRHLSLGRPPSSSRGGPPDGFGGQPSDRTSEGIIEKPSGVSDILAGRDMDLNLPDPFNPSENPLATLGQEEMSEDEKYWRTRQSEKEVTYTRIVDDLGCAYAVGKRKTSVARVWIQEGTGHFVINGKPWVEYFPRVDHRDQVLRPYLVTETVGNFDMTCEVSGGGGTGQAEALRHGIARALQKWDPVLRSSLKKDGLLTRDSRVVESKKYGHKKARKSFQWVKR